MFAFIYTDVMLIIVSLIMCGFSIYLTEQIRLLPALAAIAVFVVIVHQLTDIDVLGAIWNNPILVIPVIIAYTAIGCVATLKLKWRNYVTEATSCPSFIRSYDEWVQNNPGVSDDEFYSDPSSYSMHPANHKYRLANWIFLWVFWMMGSLLTDPAIWLWNYVYDLIGGALLKLSTIIGQSAVKAAKENAHRAQNSKGVKD